MNKIKVTLFLFFLGSVLYSLLEILFRGFTHWTMSITGGICLVILYAIETKVYLSLFKKCILGSAIITTLEFLVGIIDNIIMNWNVWDYSGMFGNLMGQICVVFSVLWFLICIPVMYLCRFINKVFIKYTKY